MPLGAAEPVAAAGALAVGGGSNVQPGAAEVTQAASTRPTASTAGTRRARRDAVAGRIRNEPLRRSGAKGFSVGATLPSSRRSCRRRAWPALRGAAESPLRCRSTFLMSIDTRLPSFVLIAIWKQHSGSLRLDVARFPARAPAREAAHRSALVPPSTIVRVVPVRRPARDCAPDPPVLDPDGHGGTDRSHAHHDRSPTRPRPSHRDRAQPIRRHLPRGHPRKALVAGATRRPSAHIPSRCDPGAPGEPAGRSRPRDPSILRSGLVIPCS